MAHKIVFDLETRRAFDEVEGRDPKKLGISIIVVYDYADNTYKPFLEDQLKDMWPLFESADLIIGYNNKGFDNKVLNAYYPGDISALPYLDLLEEFYKAAGFRIRLDDMAGATLGEKKIGHGLQAIEWYKQGDFDSLEKYCTQDVKVTKDLYEFALKNGFVRYTEINETKEMPFNVKAWESIVRQAVNYTLPF